jgi:hypothetical protein
MPYITSVERHGIRMGLLKGIETSLEIKFEAAGLQLLPEIQGIQDVGTLEAILRPIKTSATPEELRRVWAPGA